MTTTNKELQFNPEDIQGDSIPSMANDPYYNKGEQAQLDRVFDFVERTIWLCERIDSGNIKKVKSARNGALLENIHLLNLDKPFKIQLITKLSEIFVNDKPVTLSLPNPKGVGDFSIHLKW